MSNKLNAQYFIKEIKRLQKRLSEEENKPDWEHKKENISFWTGCISQMLATAQELLSPEEYSENRDEIWDNWPRKIYR